MSFSADFFDKIKKEANGISGKKATVLIVSEKSTDKLEAQYNPSEYKITKSPKMERKKRSKENEPLVNYTGLNLQTLTVKLTFNDDKMYSPFSAAVAAAEALLGSGKKLDIATKVKMLEGLTLLDETTHEPPGCAVVWGELKFVGFCQTVTSNYTMFDNLGKPLRADVTLTVKGLNYGEAKQKGAKFSPDRSKIRTVTDVTNIWTMAQKEYGNVREWRRIADANGLMDPFDTYVGMKLNIPPLE